MREVTRDLDKFRNETHEAQQAFVSRQQFNEQIGAQTNLLQGLDRQVGENRVTCAAVEDQMN
jgi:hypothetical protein